jgi:predicted TIM-barrel fold metal-dependent hydrolase
MLIVDGQIHLWEKGTPSAHHRQEPYSAEQAIAGMGAAGVDRALIHPVLWDPDSNELAVEAVRKYPDRFAVMGWFYLDDPNGRDLVAHWKERPGMLGMRFYTNERHPQSWFTEPMSGTRNPGSPTACSTGCGPPQSAPKCRWRSARRCSCRRSARSPSAIPA